MSIPPMPEDPPGGLVSKPNTNAEVVIDLFNERMEREIEEAIAEDRLTRPTDPRSLLTCSQYHYPPRRTTPDPLREDPYRPCACGHVSASCTLPEGSHRG